ncbi:DNA repair protein RadC [Fibrobacterales bacterium]|nr:DNA repair protein RadC [Fibrobacterales bacterium]
MENENQDKMLPRERICNGELTKLSSEDLLCVVLGRGMQGKSVFALAKEISNFLENLSRMPTLEELSQIKGLGLAKSAQILACLELSGRFLLGFQDKEIVSPVDLMPQLAFIKHSKQEIMVLVTLSGGNRIIGIHTLTKGLVNSTPLQPREAFAPALEDRAAAVIFAHNHPSGATKPSNEDLALTKRLCDSGRILQIPVLDHLIITAKGFCCLRERYGYLFRDV